MRIAALLSWFDEERATLSRAIVSAARAGCTHLVAVDGRYALYDATRTLSPHRQRMVIEQTAEGFHLDLTLSCPREPWPTEMEKRTHMFALAAVLPVDWLLVLDADFEVKPCDLGVLLGQLGEGPGHEVAQVELHTPPGPGGNARFGPPPVMPFRCLYRQGTPIVVGPNHYTYTRTSYRTPKLSHGDITGHDTRYLWGNDTENALVPAADLTADVKIVHHTYHRPKPRVSAQFDYYRARDKQGVEAGLCRKCRERTALFMVPAGVKELSGDRDLSIGWAEVCEQCRDSMVEAAVVEAARLGADEGACAQLRTLVQPLHVAAPTE